MEQNVEFFRLVTGEDIVSEYEINTNTNSYVLYNPCKVVYLTSAKPGYLSISLMQWIFSKLCAEQTFELPMNQVLVKSAVSESMTDHYFQSVQHFESKELKKRIEFDAPITTEEEEVIGEEEDLYEQILDKINELKGDKRKLH